MDISSARLAALLSEAMMPQAVPSAKADPVKTALVKALVAPPAPSGAPVRPGATPTLPVLFPATAAKVQQTAPAEMMQAYLAVAEPGGEAAGDAIPVANAARRPTDGETAQRGLALPLATGDEGAPVRPATLPWLPLLASELLPLRRTPAGNATARRGRATAGPNEAAKPENRRTSVGLMSLTAGLLAAAVVGFVLVVLR